MRAAHHAASPMRTVAVVLNYRTPGATLDAVAALRESEVRLAQIVVVDNSGDLDAGWRRRCGDDVRYVPTARNLGFAGGMNVGIGCAIEAEADAVLLVNSDARVAADCVSRLTAVMREHPDIGIVGPIVRAGDGSERVTSRGLRFAPRTGRMRDLAADGRAPSHATLELVDAVSGCVMLISRAVVEAVGRLDEAYFFGFEDLDYCLRARAAGWRSAVVPAAVVRHDGCLSIGPASPRRLYFAARNHQRLVAATGRGAPTLVRGLRFGFVVGLNAAHALRARGGSARERLRAVWDGTRDHLRGRYGDGPWPTHARPTSA